MFRVYGFIVLDSGPPDYSDPYLFWGEGGEGGAGGGGAGGEGLGFRGLGV